MWSERSAKDKQLHEQKAAQLKEKYEKDIAVYQAKGKSGVGKKGLVGQRAQRRMTQKMRKKRKMGMSKCLS